MRILWSGGQTGADRAALDVAIEVGIPHGGYCPRGRKAEDGPIPARYRLVECTSADYRLRTRLNVELSNGTMVLVQGSRLTPGSSLTLQIAQAARKPAHVYDLLRCQGETVCVDGIEGRIEDAVAWLNGLETANFAGSRESASPGIYDRAAAFLRKLFTHPEFVRHPAQGT